MTKLKFSPKEFDELYNETVEDKESAVIFFKELPYELAEKILHEVYNDIKIDDQNFKCLFTMDRRINFRMKRRLIALEIAPDEDGLIVRRMYTINLEGPNLVFPTRERRLLIYEEYDTDLLYFLG